MKHATVYNLTQAQIAYDDHGHAVYPREWGSVPLTDEVRRLIIIGDLKEFDHAKLTDMKNPELLAAAKLTDEANSRPDPADSMSESDETNEQATPLRVSQKNTKKRG